MIPGLHFLTKYGWFAGFFAAGIVYCALAANFAAGTDKHAPSLQENSVGGVLGQG
jgi:cytosine/uracil/thiamine/allantoin permease